MLIRRALFFPEAGGMGDVRSYLERLLQRRGQQGYRVELARAELSADFPAFSLSTELADMAAVEAHIRASQAEQSAAAGTTDRLPSLRLPVRYELYSVLFAAEPCPSPAWTMRTMRTSLAGRFRELSQSGVERARREAQAGSHVSVLSLIVGPGSLSLVTETSVESLSEWEQINARAAADPTTPEFFATEAALQAGPVTRELFEVLIPYGA